MQVMVNIASLDIMYGEFWIGLTFKFYDTGPVNDVFDEYDVGSMNFIDNSGSMFLPITLIVIV